jgi:probable rRNA maturation factor
MITIEPGNMEIGTAHVDRASLRRYLLRAQAAVGLQGEVHVLLSDDAALRRLNRLFRGMDKATDVLSFPAANESGGMAGDLAISLEHAQRQAEQFGHTLSEEVRILLLHGLLHLAGEDHKVDSGEMALREQKLRAQLRLPVGLIERVQPEAAAAAKPVRSTAAVHRANARGAAVRRRRA